MAARASEPIEMAERKQQRGATTESASALAARHTRARRGLPKETKTAARAKGAPARRTRSNAKSRRTVQTGPSPFGRVMRAVALLILGLVVFGGTATLMRSLLGSQFFNVKQIEVEGNNRLSREELLALVEGKAHGGLWQVPLEEIREILKRNPWIRDVEVARQFPDKVRVKISEREPYALARRNDNAVVWIDRDGTVLGDQTKFNLEVVPPIISGLMEGAAAKVMEANRRHLTLYQDLLNALDAGEPRLSAQVDEVIFDGVDGLKLRVQGGRVEVLVGTQDFRKRTEEALRILQAVERKDISALRLLKISDAERLLSGRPIAYINATVPERAIVGLAE